MHPLEASKTLSSVAGNRIAAARRHKGLFTGLIFFRFDIRLCNSLPYHNPPPYLNRAGQQPHPAAKRWAKNWPRPDRAAYTFPHIQYYFFMIAPVGIDLQGDLQQRLRVGIIADSTDRPIEI